MAKALCGAMTERYHLRCALKALEICCCFFPKCWDYKHASPHLVNCSVCSLAPGIIQRDFRTLRWWARPVQLTRGRPYAVTAQTLVPAASFCPATCLPHHKRCHFWKHEPRWMFLPWIAPIRYFITVLRHVTMTQSTELRFLQGGRQSTR